MPLTTDNLQPTLVTPPPQPLLKSPQSPKPQVLLLAAAAAAGPLAAGDHGRAALAAAFDELRELGVLERLGGTRARSEDRWLGALDRVAGARPRKRCAEELRAPAAPLE